MIIPGFNIFKYLQAHLLSCFEFGTIDQFRFESFEKTFSHSIIPTISLSTHTLLQLQGFQKVDSLFAGILDTPVRMEYHSFCKRSVPIGHPYGRDYGMGGIHMIAYGPPDQFAIKKIQHTGQIKKPILTRNIGQVRDTCFHRLILIKPAIQQIWCNLIVVRGIRRHFESSREFAAQAHFPHMACYGGSRDGSSGYLQILRQPGASIASLGSKIGIPDLFVQLHILTLTRALRIFKPAVITAPGHFQYFTHHLDRPLFRVVFLYKEIDQRSLLEMMLKAFFNMSRSVSASPRRFSSSAILLVSSLNDWTPCPGKLASPFCWYSFRQRYRRKGAIPNSCASSETFLRSKLSLTAFSLNALSKCVLCFLILHKNKRLCLTLCPG